jgi:hypothetical protein
VWKDLPNVFIEEKEAKKFSSDIPRHVSNRIIKTTTEILNEYNSDSAHYLS